MPAFLKPKASSYSLGNTSCRSALDLPNEILFCIAQCLSIADLLSLCQVNQNLYTIGIQVLAKILQKIKLRLFFDQESRWRFAVDMILAQAAPTRFTFMPIDKKSFCLFSSRVLRKPIIYKVILDEHDVFVRSFSVDINNSGHHHRSLGPSARFIYMIREHQRGTRERWISPLKFECEPRWFCQRRRGLPQIRWETILLLMQSRMAISTSKFRIVFHKTKDESEEHKEIVDGKSRKRASQLLLSNIAVCR